MKKFFLFCMAAILLFAACTSDNIIRTKVPPRPAGQEDMLGFAADPIADVGIGVVGVGMRGHSAVKRLTYVPGCHVAAVCDVEKDRAQKSREYLEAKGLSTHEYSGQELSYRQLCEDPDVDLVYICTDWLHHVPVALYAMEHGKHVAIEVPSALTLEDCWALVNASERTRRHCMILENCCYDFFELTALQMAKSGLFGEIIHAEGAYNHNLGPFWDEYWNNWRLEYNRTHRGDLYPTHGLGPICQALGIHRGDRFTTLVSMDTDAFNGPRYVEAKTGEPCPDFKNADVTTTMMRTAKGHTVLLEHEVLVPRPYSRMYQLVGTDGYAGKYPTREVCLAGADPENADYEDLEAEKVYRGAELNELMAKYRSPILTEDLENRARAVGGHGGMDYTMDYRLVYCLNNGLPLDMDVYDLAEWCCVAELSRISLEHGSAPVEVPDFTRGAWDRIQGYSYAFAK